MFFFLKALDGSCFVFNYLSLAEPYFYDTGRFRSLSHWEVLISRNNNYLK